MISMIAQNPRHAVPSITSNTKLSMYSAVNHKNAHYTLLRKMQQYHMCHASSADLNQEERQEALLTVCYDQ